jgi:hypothetical protein
LTPVATFAVRAIRGADGAGPTLLEDGRTDTILATDPFVREVDAIQYGQGVGPRISAAALRRTMRSGVLGSEPRWPTFGPHVDKLGVHSVLSLPLLTPDGVCGAMNVYARARNVFDDHASNWARWSRSPPQSPYKTHMCWTSPDGWPSTSRLH